MDLKTIRDAVQEFYGSQPHPDAPDVTISEYEGYKRAAYFLNEKTLRGAEPKPDMVVHTVKTLKSADMSPGEFEHIWTTAKPIANRLLNRDPSMFEVVQHRGAPIQAIHQHYLNHPYPGYEEVTAGQVARYMRAAEPIARRHGRTPNMEEVTRFAAAGYGSEHMDAHYGETK